jgi:hypothetical protein
MKAFVTVCFVGWLFCAQGQLPANPPAKAGPPVETIVCVRHGEKPADGLGQLTCRGLNRALALPDVLLAKYGAPQFVFAPSTTQKKDKGTNYNYIRPLMTIEPTAVRVGLPVNTQFAYDDIKDLEAELQKPQYEGATVFVAWEHDMLDDFAKDLVQTYRSDAKVPPWDGTDFDSIFVMKITHDGGHATLNFSVDHEGLNNESDDCPGSGKGANTGK